MRGFRGTSEFREVRAEWGKDEKVGLWIKGDGRVKSVKDSFLIAVT